MMNFDLKNGDCLVLLKSLPDNSVDSVVTDPPYGINFNGSRWDSDVPGVEVWAECLRVLKPGGHLLAFAGTRTQHRMAVRIEDAGFEIRDMIAWVYGSGFPKSMDLSKAIDKMDAAEEQYRRRLIFTAWVRSTGVTSSQIDQATGKTTGSHYTTSATQPSIMPREDLEKCRHLFKEIPDWVERECDIRSVQSKNMANRAVIDSVEMTDTRSARIAVAYSSQGVSKVPRRVVDITAPATEQAKRWEGWGTALKPALEPITVARKPLIGSVAQNVIRHGTGAVNINSCRVESPNQNEPSRFPANFIHDDGAPVLEILGQAARFFYSAKAGREDRDFGNNHPTVKPEKLMRYLCRLVTPPGGVVLDPFMGSGSTGRAAILEGFSFLGFELDPGFFGIAEKRISSILHEIKKDQNSESHK